MFKHEKHIIILLVILVLALAVLNGFSGLRLYRLRKDRDVLLNQITRLTVDLNSAKRENNLLTDELNKQQLIVAGFRVELEDFADTVTVLDKLSKTDSELLQKYSKIYFLNEHYRPKELVFIDQKYLADPDKPIQISAQVWPYLRNLLQAAENDGLNLKIVSGYRSFGVQSSLKSNYKITYGTGANKFSADQGYSEHQLGTTVDFTEAGLNAGSPLSDFETTQSYQWLLDQAYRFGFSLSYPKNNQYYVFEPWHWRFVGIKLATDLRNQDRFFYDLEQRQIDEYLVDLFD